MRAQWYHFYSNWTIIDVTSRVSSVCRSSISSTPDIIMSWSTHRKFGAAAQLESRRFRWYHLRVNSIVIELGICDTVDDVESACSPYVSLEFCYVPAFSALKFRALKMYLNVLVRIQVCYYIHTIHSIYTDDCALAINTALLPRFC